jgi:hypothetical protein
MAENEQESQTVELIVPTKGGYKSAGTHQAKRAPAPEKKQAPPAGNNMVSPPVAKAIQVEDCAPAAPPPSAQAQQPTPPPAPKPTAPPPAAPPPPAKPVAATPPKKKKVAATDAVGHGEVLADSMVGGFIAAMNAQAKKRGGHLLAEDVAMLSRTFEKQTENIASSITRSMNVYANSQTENQFDPERVNVFDRVLVKQFSHLLKDDDDVAKDPSAISRRILNGVFVAVRMIAGPDRIERYEQDCYLVMQRVRDDLKDEFSWDTVYADPRVKNMLRDLLVFMAPHFIKLETRLEWFLGVINSNLSEVSLTSPVAEWKLAPGSTFSVLDALFGELRANVEDDLGRLRLAKQIGGETLDTVLELIGKLDEYSANNP